MRFTTHITGFALSFSFFFFYGLEISFDVSLDVEYTRERGKSQMQWTCLLPLPAVIQECNNFTYVRMEIAKHVLNAMIAQRCISSATPVSFKSIETTLGIVWKMKLFVIINKLLLNRTWCRYLSSHRYICIVYGCICERDVTK